MPFDILVIIDEIKRFYRSEKGTVLSLLVLLFVETILYNYAFSIFYSHIVYVDPKAPPDGNFLRFYLIIIGITILAWVFDRHIFTSKNKTNIGISQFDLVDINMKSVLPGEARITIREELNQYIYSHLIHDNRYVNIGEYINAIVLPPRYAIDRYHTYSPRRFQFLDFLITGTLYNEANALVIHPQFIFVHELPILLFDEIKEHLAKKTKFEFYVDGRPNHGLNKVLHEVTYIGLIYTAAKFVHKKNYPAADKLINEVLHNLDMLYKSDDESVQFGDLDFMKIEEMLYFIKAKNLHHYGNYLFIERGKIQESKEKFKEAADVLVKRSEILNKIIEKDERIDKNAIDHSYIYAIGMLAKEKDEEKGKLLLKEIKEKVKHKDNYLLAEALFAERTDHEKTALGLYKDVLKESPENKFILRRLISIYFKKKQMLQCYKTITKLYTITKKEMYDEDFYDLKVCYRYILASFATLHLLSAFTNLLLLPVYAYHNKIISFEQTRI